jgi:hypothetical protein
MTQEPKPLNRFEVWVSEHAGPVFVAVAAAIVLCAGAFFWVWEKSGDTQDQVNVLRPQVTKINQAVCDARSLESEAKARRCAERIRVGLVNCRRYDRCRAAFIAALTYPPPARPDAASTAEGGGAQNPSTAGQQPAPGQPGGGDKGGGHDHGQRPGPKSPQPAPEAGPAPASPDTGTGSSADPGQGADQGEDESPPPSKGGVEVETCLLVVCAEVGVGR